ncbi:winged helix-turn-helix domain-containing protein [Actinoplanes sp. NPDC051494]|uniref:winged helix-turn-helix domain-containing protein n=1 Tax=Actinoplanes sp. NPDC051494 TaxID=3363907 RepID=UPI0037881E83
MAQPFLPAQPYSPGQPYSQAQPFPPGQPYSQAQPFPPAQPFPSAQPFSPALSFAPDQPFSPGQDLSPADDLAPAQDPGPGYPPRPGDPRLEVRLLTSSRQVLVGGEPMPLTRLEFDLLQFLTANPRRVFTRMQLLTGVWGYDHTGERTVDVHVRRLRVKMGAVPLITTVYGVGYRLSDDADIVIDPQN